MDNVTSATGNANAMIVSVRGNVQKIAANGAQVTAGVERLVSGVQAGKGTVGKLLVDDQLADNVDTTVANARKASSNVDDASANVKKASKNVEQASEHANQMVAEVKTSVHDFLNSPDNQKTADNLRDTISQADRATRNLASDTEAIKHNFFLRGFFHRRGYYSLTTFNRTKYARSKFVKDPGKRVWLRADDLFTTAADGGQQLSPEGQEVLDRAVSKIADDVTNNPIMVEGYSQSGPPSQRLVVSSERAGDVKKYLETKFHLNPRLIGTIPLEDKPPERTGVPSWDGICLAVVISH
jgi:phospholipid/cholesterol/gamma-HCH transport system substrate-binding protein